MPKNVPKNPVKNFAAGAFGGVCCVAAGHPFDTVKVHLQTMARITGQKPLYTGAWDCAEKILLRDGPRGLFKGMIAPIAVSAPAIAISFIGFGIGKRVQRIRPGMEMSTRQLLTAGMVAGAFTGVVITPAERIKCILQLQQKTHEIRYSGPVDCAKKLFKIGGLRSAFQGMGATVLREVPGSAIQYTIFENVMDFLTPAHEKRFKLSYWNSFLAGGIAGSCFWMVVMPADVLKSHIQTNCKDKFPRGMRDVLPKILKEDGLKGLYRGAIPAIVRAFPANAACFAGYDAAMKFLNFVWRDKTQYHEEMQFIGKENDHVYKNTENLTIIVKKGKND